MILLDAGPLVALVDASDSRHRACVQALKAVDEPLATVWPVVSEALTRLAALPKGQAAVHEMLERRAVGLLDLGLDDLGRLRELQEKGGKRRLSLAEAALVRVAEREGLDTIFTLNKAAFAPYRSAARKRFRILP